MLRVITATFLSFFLATASSADIIYRGSPHIVTDRSAVGGDAEVGDITVSSRFKLTAGEHVSIPFSGGPQGAVYRLEPSVPGLSVDPSSSAVVGVPEGRDGAVVSFRVQAENPSGRIIASSPVVERVLRHPLAIITIPFDVDLVIGGTLPTSGIVAEGAGGERETWFWSLLGAPEWMDIQIQQDGNARIGVKSGTTPQRFSGEVFLSLSDGEGRRATERSFFVSVQPETCNSSEGIPCRDGTFLMSITGGGYEAHGVITTIPSHKIYINGTDLSEQMTYDKAASACENLVAHGYDDWTLINRNTASDIMSGDYSPKRMILLAFGYRYWVGSFEEAPKGRRKYLHHEGRGTTSTHVTAPITDKMKVRCMRKSPL